jgi:hypothetical protein
LRGGAEKCYRGRHEPIPAFFLLVETATVALGYAFVRSGFARFLAFKP